MADMVVSVTFDADPILKAFKAHERKTMEAIGQGVVGAAETCMALSKAVYCPVITGTLRSTGQVGPVVIKRGLISVEMSYGGPAAPYAAAVHNAPPDKGQGKSQYLAIPTYAVGRTLDKRVRDAVHPIVR